MEAWRTGRSVRWKITVAWNEVIVVVVRNKWMIWQSGVMDWKGSIKIDILVSGFSKRLDGCIIHGARWKLRWILFCTYWVCGSCKLSPNVPYAGGHMGLLLWARDTHLGLSSRTGVVNADTGVNNFVQGMFGEETA